MTRLFPLLLLLLPPASTPDERVFLVPGFERVRIDGVYSVRITHGMSGKVRALGSSAALDALDVQVSGSTLTVRTRSDARGATAPAELIVETPQLLGVQVNGGGRIAAERMHGRRVEAAINGSGSIAVDDVAAERLTAIVIGSGAMRLSGRAAEASIRSNGAGSIDAAELEARDLSLIAETSGETQAQVRSVANVNALGLGQVTISGSARCVVRGPGPVDCAGQVERR